MAVSSPVHLQYLGRRRAHHRAHLNRHVQWCPTRPRRRRGSCSDRISPVRPVDIDDPVAGKKFLRFGEHAICDRNAILARPDQLCLVRRGQALGRYQFAGSRTRVLAAWEGQSWARDHDRHFRSAGLRARREGGIGLHATAGRTHASADTRGFLIAGNDVTSLR